MDNKIFRWALFISLILHLAVLGVLSLEKAKRVRQKKDLIEITYKVAKTKEPIRLKPATQKNLSSLKKLETPQKVKVLSKRDEFAPTVEQKFKESVKFSPQDKGFGDKEVTKVKGLDVERRITVPMLKTEKITNFQYLNYNQLIRETIKQRAYAYVNNPEFQSGEVYLTFVLSSEGELKGVKIIESKTHANEYLREVGRKSIEESNPFPVFPKELPYPELTFNVVISFEVDEGK